MDLNPQEKSRTWWNGTLMGAAKGLAVGLVIGAASALLLTMGGEFSVVPLAVFSGVSGLISGMFNGGRSAVTSYHQNKHNQMQMHQDTKLKELDGRVQTLEYAQPMNRQVNTIIARGPLKEQSFADAELDKRSEPVTSERTLQ